MNGVRLLVLVNGVTVAVFQPFISVILASRGFGPESIGIVTSLAAVGFTLAVPAWGHLADVRLGRPRTLRLSAAITAVVLAAVLGPWPVAVIAALFIGYAVVASSWQPLVDAITVNALRGRDEYARVRLLSSLSFAFATVGAGLIYTRFGYGVAPIVGIVGIVGLGLATYGVGDVGRANLRAHAAAASTGSASTGSESTVTGRTWRFGSAGVALRVAPRLVGVLAAVLLLYIGVISGYTFLSLRLTELGGGPSEVSFAAGLSAAAEVPAMLMAGWVAARIGRRGMFVASTLVYVGCFMSWAVVDVPWIIIASRFFTGIGFAGTVVSTVLMIATLLPADLQATGQALFQTVSFGIAAIIANVVGGVLYARVGYAAVFELGAVLAVVAAAVGFFAFADRPAAPPLGSAAR